MHLRENSMTAKEYAALLIAESKKPKSERSFTIANVPVKMRGEVGYWLRQEYGGNESDKQMGQAVNKLAFGIPAFATLNWVIPGISSLMINPVTRKIIVEGTLGYMGGKVVDNATRQLSNNKYQSFSDYIYDSTGLRKWAENTSLELPAKILADMANPGYYVSGLSKPVSNIVYKFGTKVKPGPTVIKFKNVRQNINEGVKDALDRAHNKNLVNEPVFFSQARNEGQKQFVKTTPTFTTTKGVLVDFPDRPVFRNSTNTAAITKLDDHTYSLRLSPKQGQTLSLADRKQVLNWVNDLPRHSYISGDYSSLPQGQVFTNMLNEGNLGAFLRNYIWPSKGPLMNTSGMSPDAYEYVAKLASRPGYSIRYSQAPMMSFNPLGAHGKNQSIYEGWVSSLTGDLVNKYSYVDNKLNPWLKDLGVKQPAYVDMKGNIAIPHIIAYKNKLGGKIKKLSSTYSAGTIRQLQF